VFPKEDVYLGFDQNFLGAHC